MPSMRLNTQANAGLADPTEWQTVSAKVKVKAKTRSEEDAEDASDRTRDPLHENGTKRAATVKPAPVESLVAPSAPRQYQPEELGFEVLAAYDQAWAASTSPPTKRNGQAKVPAAPPVPEPAFDAVPAPQVQPQQVPKEGKSNKAKKKAKAKQNAAADTPPTDGAVKENQNGKTNGTTASKQPQKQAGKKAEVAKITATSRSMPKALTTVASASALVDLAELSEHIKSSRLKHPKDGLLRLQLLASWLARTFSGVSYHLGAIIDKVGVNSAIAQPWGDAVVTLQEALLKCTADCHADDVSRYVLRVCEQTIAALPEKGGGQSDVGELLVLSAACRSCPLAIALAAVGLCPLRSKILSPGRVPVTLWLLGQAASAGGEGAACAIHAWSRVVLPTITYQEVSLAAKPSKKAAGKSAAKQAKPASVYHIEPAARDSAISFLSEVLLADKASVHRSALKQAARSGLPVGGDGAGEPVVPPSAVASAAAAASGSIPTARGTAAAVAAFQEDLEELCIACRNPNVVAAAVSRALATAEAAAEAEDDEAVIPAAKALIVQLSRHGDIAGDAWGKEHRGKLAGSTAILEQLALDTTLVQPLLKVPLGNETLLDALDGLEKAHHSVITSKKDTPAKELAQRASQAAKNLSYASFHVLPASAKWCIFSFVVVGIVVVTMSVHAPARIEGFLEPMVGDKWAAAVTSRCQGVVGNVGGFLSNIWDAWTGDDERESMYS